MTHPPFSGEPKATAAVVGLVGGIGSGKSFVADLFARHGGRVIDADKLGHEALRQPEIREKVVARFGPGVLGGDGEVVRRWLAEVVFADATALRDLEAVVFPYIGRRAAEEVARAKAEGARIIALDAAVMLEAGWNGVCDRLVYVHAPRAVRRGRLAARGWTDSQTAAREQAQLPLAEKAARADAAVDNGGDPERTARQVEALLRQWGLFP
jgi:dephospho-CoA kinase